jgi:hypothetical protein
MFFFFFNLQIPALDLLNRFTLIVPDINQTPWISR